MHNIPIKNFFLVDQTGHSYKTIQERGVKLYKDLGYFLMVRASKTNCLTGD